MNFKKAIWALAFMPWLASAADVVEFKAVAGDYAQCPSGYDAATPVAVINYRDFACRTIGNYGGARLTEKAAMSGASGGCNVYNFTVEKAVPATLCYQVKFQQVVGEVKPGSDVQCPSNMRLATVAEAAIFNKQACSALTASYNVARLANQGSISGDGYSCAVKNQDTDGKGHSLCVPQ
jgi:hypothetical protein